VIRRLIVRGQWSIAFDHREFNRVGLNRAAEKDRLAAEQDFKVNLKSELMLEELIRKQRERDAQMENLNKTLDELHRASNPG